MIGSAELVVRRAIALRARLLPGPLILGLLSCSFPDYAVSTAPVEGPGSGGLTTGGAVVDGGSAGLPAVTAAGAASAQAGSSGSSSVTAGAGGILQEPSFPGGGGGTMSTGGVAGASADGGRPAGGSGGRPAGGSGATTGESGAGGEASVPKACADYEDLPADCLCRDRAGHAYLFCSMGSPWSKAASRCGFYDMSLANIESPSEDSWILKEAHGISDPRPLTFFWIGASSQESPGTWHWSDGAVFWRGNAGGSQADGAYFNWRISSPQNTNSAACVFKDDNGWEDGDCAISRGYVCEAR